jgi:hypothetical protein
MIQNIGESFEGHLIEVAVFTTRRELRAQLLTYLQQASQRFFDITAQKSLMAALDWAQQIEQSYENSSWERAQQKRLFSELEISSEHSNRDPNLFGDALEVDDITSKIAAQYSFEFSDKIPRTFPPMNLPAPKLHGISAEHYAKFSLDFLRSWDDDTKRRILLENSPSAWNFPTVDNAEIWLKFVLSRNFWKIASQFINSFREKLDQEVSTKLLSKIQQFLIDATVRASFVFFSFLTFC